jgi:hypothetical protein
MAIDLTTNPGGLFRRAGKIGKALNNINTDLTAAGQLGVDVDAIEAQYNSKQDLIDSLYSQRETYRGVHTTFKSYLSALLQATNIRLADDDAHLVAKDNSTALKELIAQMTSSSDDVQATTASVSVSAASGNVGNATVIASVIGSNGKTLQYLFDETLELQVTADAVTGSATARRETCSLRGEVAVSDPLSHDWPAGSGANTTLNITDAAEDAGSNLLTNGDFETFTVANTPDNWTLVTGTAGAQFFSDSSSYTGSLALRILGDGATLSQLTQTFNTVGQTTGRLLPNKVYAVNFYHKVSSVPAAGVLRVELVDGSGTVINDDSGTVNRISQTLTGSTTSYTAVNGFFRTPKNLPTTVKLKVYLSTALSNTVSLYVDDLAVVAATEAYTGGPYVAAFAGSTNALTDDKWSLDLTVTLGGFQKLYERVFGMRSLGLTLPFDAAPTVPDSYLT